MQRKYERKSIHTIEEIRELTSEFLFESNKTKVELDGDMIKANSQRYQTFFTKGCTCVNCGIEGKFFGKERLRNSNEAYHLNLYGIDINGEEILMTKDHVIPKSKGGRNHIENYQTMCCICNYNKADKEDKE